MAVSTAPRSIAAALATRRGRAAIILIAIAAAAAIGILYRSAYPASFFSSPAADALREKIHQGVGGMKTVADMLFARSPGERAAGALANLKHKAVAAPHERALPKVRNSPLLSPLASIVAPAAPLPPVAEAPAVAAPLYNVVTATPAVAEAPPPTFFPGMPLPPPAGGLIIPPVVTQIVPPSPLPTPAPVPEPASWAMMLIGFAFIGRIFRRQSGTAFA